MSTNTEADEPLIARIAAGDETAFRVFAGRHLERILRLARRFLGSATDADDVAQETLVRIWKNAGRWRSDRSQVTTWIYTIVYRLCVDRLRTSGKFQSGDLSHLADPSPGIVEALSQASELQRLAVALEGLEPRQRAALGLFYYEEMSGKEAAAVLGIGLQAFWSLLHRARQAVQAQVKS